LELAYQADKQVFEQEQYLFSNKKINKTKRSSWKGKEMMPKIKQESKYHGL